MEQAGRLLERRGVRAALLAAVLALAAAVRLAPWSWVMDGPEHRIVGDGDVLYHLLQAGRLVQQGLGAVWHDPGLNYPLGADVPWPPLFDAILAGAGWLAAGGSAPDAPTLLAAAIWVPPVMGVLMVLLMAWLGRALLGGRRPWLDAALVLALLPSHAVVTPLGRADQHALEPVLLGLMVLAAARLARGGAAGPVAAGARAAAALVGLGAALSFWNWNGSALYLALLAGFAAAWHALAAPGEEGPAGTALHLAAGLLGGAFLLVVTVFLLGPPGAVRTASLSGLTGLQPVLVAGTALACAVVAAARRWRPAATFPERAVTAAAALLLPPALLLLLPWTSEGLGRGLNMLGARGWYKTILEFRPLLPSGLSPLSTDLTNVLSNHGLTPLAVVAALPLAWRRWRREPAERGPALLFGVLSVSVLVIGWARNRFGVYLSLAEALATALLARELAAWVGARVAARWGAALAARGGWPARLPGLAGPAAGVALAALLLGPVLPTLPGGDWASPTKGRYTDLAPLSRLAAQVPMVPGREAILSPWSHGHDLRYFSGRPVVSSPFGVEGGAGALEVDAAWHRATDQATAEAVLAARRVGLVVVFEPLDEVVSLEAFAPPEALKVFDLGADPDRLDNVRILPPFRMLTVVRLWLWDGMWGETDGRPMQTGIAAVDGFRLVGETDTLSIWHKVGVPMFKLFQPVPGAQLQVRGARPGASVEASTRLRTNRGRVVEWLTRATADAAGVARFRLPYATGQNGAVGAAPWRLTDGQRATGLVVDEAAVLGGLEVEAALGK